MKGKNEIITKINDKLIKLPESKLAKINTYFENIPTDTSSNEHSPKTQKLKVSSEALKYFESLGDKHNTSELLIDLVERDFKSIKEHLGLEDVDNVRILRELAINMCNKEYQASYEIEKGVANSIYGEAKTQLELLGEDVAEIINHYDFV